MATATTEYDGPERRRGAVEMSKSARELGTEVAQLRQAVSTLATTLPELMPRPEIETLVRSVASEEHRHRQRLVALVAGPLAVLAALLAVGLWQNRGLEQSVERNEEILELVRDCSTPAGRCFQDQLHSPQLAEVIAELNEQVACMLLIPPEGRTREGLARTCGVRFD